MLLVKLLIKVRGNAVNLAYTLTVPYKETEVTLSMDDWMYPIAPGVIMNETLMTKWGFTVGKVTLVIMQADVVNDIPRLIQRFEALIGTHPVNTPHKNGLIVQQPCCLLKSD